MPMGELQISVVVPCFNAGGTLRRCLESLIGQNTQRPYEVLVVENGSSDDTARIAEECATGRPGLVRICREATPGAYAARNRGLAEALGSVLLLTDADCVVNSGWVDALARALDDPTVLVVGGEILPERDQRGLLARYAREARILSAHHGLEHPLGAFFQTANLGVRVAHARSIEGFDARLFSGGDADFCWRLARAHPEGRFLLAPDATVEHHHRETVGALYRQFRRYGQSDVALAWRYRAPPLRIAAKLALDTARVLFAPLLSAVSIPLSLVRRDALPIASPLLRAVRVLGRRAGQVRALLRPKDLHRA